MSYEGEKDMPSKISKFVRTIGIINQVFKLSLVQKHTRLNICRTLTRPVLIYGSEAWTIRKADEKILQAAEMKFMTKTDALTLWDHKRNEEILKKFES
jgi:tRNA U34 5-methylaminomethyl-2-thiouridine-forming methyltransferase MnmC